MKTQNAQHTPGPWEIRSEQGDGVLLGLVEGSRRAAERAAQMIDCRNGLPGVAGRSKFFSGISLLPCEAWAEFGVAGDGIFLARNGWALRAAIARAEGRP